MVNNFGFHIVFESALGTCILVKSKKPYKNPITYILSGNGTWYLLWAASVLAKSPSVT